MEKECRDINALHPVVKTLAQALYKECHAAGIPIQIGETYRSVARQDYLYAQGRTRPGAIITYAEGSKMSSYHQWGLAFDIFINHQGNIYDPKLLAQAGAIGKSIGLEWGGDWKNFKDTPHFEYTQGLSTVALKSGQTLQAVLISINGKLRPVRGFQIDGHNYIKLQDLSDSRIQIGYDENQRVPILSIV